jgi:hypothetical protein
VPSPPMKKGILEYANFGITPTQKADVIFCA